MSRTPPKPGPGRVIVGRCSACTEWLQSRTGHRGGAHPVRGEARHAHRQHRRPWQLIPGDQWAVHAQIQAAHRAAERLARDTAQAYDPTYHYGTERIPA